MKVICIIIFLFSALSIYCQDINYRSKKIGIGYWNYSGKNNIDINYLYNSNKLKDFKFSILSSIENKYHPSNTKSIGFKCGLIFYFVKANIKAKIRFGLLTEVVMSFGRSHIYDRYTNEKVFSLNEARGGIALGPTVYFNLNRKVGFSFAYDKGPALIYDKVTDCASSSSQKICDQMNINGKLVFQSYAVFSILYKIL